MLQVLPGNHPSTRPCVAEVLAVIPEALRVSLLLFPSALPGVAEVLRCRVPKASGPYRVGLPSPLPVATRTTRLAAPTWSKSIMSYNGGAVMAMRGKNCVAIAADRRFGIQAQMVTTDFQKIFPMGDRLFIGLAGLATDVQTVSQRLKFRLNLYELKEGRQIKPKTFMSMVSNLLYERRFGPYYVEPVIAGLDPKTFEPFICSLDLIGCPMITEDFVVSGTCAEQMYGMCESLWEPNMEPEDLFETISQAMLNAVDRDAVSGMGVIVHVMRYKGRKNVAHDGRGQYYDRMLDMNSKNRLEYCSGFTVDISAPACGETRRGVDDVMTAYKLLFDQKKKQRQQLPITMFLQPRKKEAVPTTTTDTPSETMEEVPQEMAPASEET
ncbi:PSB3 protein, partial [Polypterus senegalus]